jgi:hypothetical protein
MKRGEVDRGGGACFDPTALTPRSPAREPRLPMWADVRRGGSPPSRPSPASTPAARSLRTPDPLADDSFDANSTIGVWHGAPENSPCTRDNAHTSATYVYAFGTGCNRAREIGRTWRNGGVSSSLSPTRPVHVKTKSLYPTAAAVTSLQVRVCAPAVDGASPVDRRELG